MEMRELDQSKHSLDKIFEREKPNYSVKKLLSKFHEKLIASLGQRNCIVSSRTHAYGITYFCDNNKNKAFLFINVKPECLSAIFFIGDKSIYGLAIGTWSNKNDQKGSVPFSIQNEMDLNKSIIYSLDAYKIASTM